jgi:hypothetical protein
LLSRPTPTASHRCRRAISLVQSLVTPAPSGISPHYTTKPRTNLIASLCIFHHPYGAAVPCSRPPASPGRGGLDGDVAHGLGGPAGGRGRDAARRAVPRHSGRVHGGVLRRGRRGRRGGDGHGREQAARAAGRVRVHRLRRAPAGQRAVLAARGVLLQLPARRRGQPVLARVQRHHPVPGLIKSICSYCTMLLFIARSKIGINQADPALFD